MEANESVEIYTVTSPAEASMICNMLRDAGIQAIPDGGQPNSLVGIESVAILVHADDADRARKILERLEEHGHHKAPPHQPKRD